MALDNNQNQYFQASGTMRAVDNNNGTVTVTSIEGTRHGGPIEELLPIGSDPDNHLIHTDNLLFFDVDDLFAPGCLGYCVPVQLDANGIMFSMTANSWVWLSRFPDGTPVEEFLIEESHVTAGTNNNIAEFGVRFEGYAPDVPEPSTLALCGYAMACALLLRYRRFACSGRRRH